TLSRDPGGGERTQREGDHPRRQHETPAVAGCRCAALLPRRRKGGAAARAQAPRLRLLAAAYAAGRGYQYRWARGLGQPPTAGSVLSHAVIDAARRHWLSPSPASC